MLNKQLGLSYGKVAALFQRLRLTRGRSLFLDFAADGCSRVLLESVPGCYSEAVARVQALALRVIAERLDH